MTTTLTLRYTERFGAVDRILSILRRRGFPIGGLTLERTHQPDIGRMTVSVKTPEAVEQVQRHLSKLPDVLDVTLTGGDDAVRREYALARVRCAPAQRAEVMALLAAHDARAVTMTAEGVVVETAGSQASLDALFSALEPYGIEESARTSPIALRRSSQ